MGMNTILMLIAGIVMSTMVASQVAPSIVEGVKVKKVQTQTINNQEVIFEAIKRYTTIKQKAPIRIEDLISEGYLDEKVVEDNGFGEKYEISVSPTTGVATIETTIEDPKAQEAFLNSFMGTSKPSCKVDEKGKCVPNKFETKYVLPNEIMHGNALLMTGVPIQDTAPDSSIYKYWYDTSDPNKAVFKLFNGTNWVEVNLGGEANTQTYAPGNYKLIIPENFNVSTSGNIKTFERLIIRSGTLRVSFTLKATNNNSNVYARIYLNGVAKGTNHTAKLSPITITEDIVVNIGDVIQLFVSASLGVGAQISNFRIMSSKETIFPLGF